MRRYPGRTAAATATALLAWAVPTYVPRILDSFGSDPAPLSVHVQDNPAQIDTFEDLNFYGVLARDRFKGGPSGGTCSGFHPWLLRAGGADAHRTNFRLSLQGRSKDPVMLEAMRARVVRRAAPLDGVVVGCSSAGTANIRAVTIDLDRPGTSARYTSEGNEKPFGFTLAKGETENFNVRASTLRCYCQWELELELLVDGKSRTTTVTDGGRPFRTTAWDGRSDYSWNWGASPPRWDKGTYVIAPADAN